MQEEEQCLDAQKFQTLLEAHTEAVELLIQAYLPKEEGYQRTVLEAMNYSVMAGGKRLRPILMQETYKMFGGKGREIEPFMAAIEMIHTYSLVHDDLPAMDNDEYRRGRKTTHVVYGEGMGILAGDALLNYAFETALQAFSLGREQENGIMGTVPAGKLKAIAEALYILARKAGVYGMIGGQTADIEAETKKEDVTADKLLFIHEHKTAALIQAAMMIGAVLAGADEKSVSMIEKCAYNIGVAFQIQDDILDVTGDSAELGKTAGSDQKNHKQTYVTIKGMEESGADVRRLSEEAVNILNSFEGEHTFLKTLICRLIDRRR